MSIKTPTAIQSPATIDHAATIAPSEQIAEPSTDGLYPDGRYYLSIKTAPHTGWEQPAGWRWDSLTAAKRGAKEADRQWMAVRLMDGATGAEIEWT